VFFSFILDVYSRKIVEWQLASNMRTALVLDALRMALTTRQPGADFTLITHSDYSGLTPMPDRNTPATTTARASQPARAPSWSLWPLGSDHHQHMETN
jgi:transposase InsO family protein